jgi:putative ABC transport system substrate-binding protein
MKDLAMNCDSAPQSLSRRTVTALLLVLALASCAQPPERARVTIVSLMSYDILDESVAGIREGLAQAGYTGDAIEIREVNANGETTLLSGYAREIVATKPDVIVPVSTPVAQAIVAASSTTQPVVFSTVTNPNDIGYDKHPANLTGVADVVNYDANLALVRELVPAAKRVGMIYNPGERNSQFGVAASRKAATAHGIELVLVSATDSNSAVIAARTLVGRVDALYIGSDNTAASAIEGIVAATTAAKLPVIASDAGSVRKGALAAISVDYRKLGIAAGRLTAAVLREHKNAGQYPAVRFLGDTLVVNQTTADRIGMVFPPSLAARHPLVIRGKTQ